VIHLHLPEHIHVRERRRRHRHRHTDTYADQRSLFLFLSFSLPPPTHTQRQTPSYCIFSQKSSIFPQKSPTILAKARYICVNKAYLHDSVILSAKRLRVLRKDPIFVQKSPIVPAKERYISFKELPCLSPRRSTHRLAMYTATH